MSSLIERAKRKRLLYGFVAGVLVTLIGIGVMASNGWLGSEPGAAATGFRPLNPFTPPPSSPTPTPQLSKEYIHAASSRLVAVVDANASEIPPADLAVWRPSTGVWYILGVTQQTAWGQSGDQPVQGDFDGDGKTDFCVFRPGDTTWYIVKSSDGSYQYQVFGASADKPSPADFDGDGKTDIATFRASTGTWYVFQSTTQSQVTYSLGQNGDKAAPGDYDGDGKADPGVWRYGTTSQFHIRRSTDGAVQTLTMGSSSTDEPVSADYDGDGKANFALRQGANWLIMNANLSGTTTTAWQQANDFAVQNDYDGDGKVDIAVWRNQKNAVWYIRKSTDLSTRTDYWGGLDDVPVPALYRR